MTMPDATYMNLYIKEGKAATISLKNIYESLLVSSRDNPDHIFRISFSDFFVKHREHLKDAIQFYQVPESMFYKPKMVSMDLYGTTELWLALLRLNNMRNITEFHLPIIQIYSPVLLQEYIEIFFKREGKSG